MIEMQAPRQRACENRLHVGAVALVVGEAERGDGSVSERDTQQGTSVVPAPLVPGERPYARLCERRAQAEPVENAGGVRAHNDARADLAQFGCLLVDVRVESGPDERQSRGEAADAAADKRDRKVVPGHGPILPESVRAG
jgi:hypothetical protein